MTDRELIQMALDALGKYPIRIWGTEAKKHLQARLAQPEREWQGLTDAQMFAALISVDKTAVRFPDGFKQFAKAIEAKLKEKNS